ncbi:hypothetical protein [Clostridium tunisiense]|uniref:hypothetical protein n=1 Tax=Clostridium tunisiense TaxID=219748 RepID=UPI00037A266D|nr:hypothetical protein [Clostridium tunisiense]
MWVILHGFCYLKLLLSQNISKSLDIVNESVSPFIIESKKLLFHFTIIESKKLDIDAT